MMATIDTEHEVQTSQEQVDDASKCMVDQKKSLNPTGLEIYTEKSKKDVYIVPTSAVKCGCKTALCPPYAALGAGLLVQARINGGTG